MACALAKKSSASLVMAGLAVELDAGTVEFEDAAVVFNFAALDADETDLEVVLDVNGEPVLVDATDDAVGRARTPDRAVARDVKEVVAEDEVASSFPDVLVAGSSMLAGVAEREPVGVGLAWMAWRGDSSAALLESMANFARRLPGPEREKVLGAILVARVAGVAKGVLVDVGE